MRDGVRYLGGRMSEKISEAPAQAHPLAVEARRLEPPAAPVAPRIHDLPESERPREKAALSGPSALSDPELLALFFGSGVVGVNAIELGRRFMERYRSLNALSRLSVEELCAQKGIGKAKAMHLAAAFELGKRLSRESHDGQPMNRPDAVLDLVGAEMRAEPQEVRRVSRGEVSCVSHL